MNTPISVRAWNAPVVDMSTHFRSRQRAHRRERLIRYGVALAAIVLPAAVAIVVMGYILGRAL